MEFSFSCQNFSRPSISVFTDFFPFLTMIVRIYPFIVVSLHFTLLLSRNLCPSVFPDTKMSLCIVTVIFNNSSQIHCVRVNVHCTSTAMKSWVGASGIPLWKKLAFVVLVRWLYSLYHKVRVIPIFCSKCYHIVSCWCTKKIRNNFLWVT